MRAPALLVACAALQNQDEAHLIPQHFSRPLPRVPGALMRTTLDPPPAGAAAVDKEERLTDWFAAGADATAARDALGLGKPDRGSFTDPSGGRLVHWATRERQNPKFMRKTEEGLKDLEPELLRVIQNDARRAAASFTVASDAAVEEWANRKAKELLRLKLYENLAKDPVFGPFIKAADAKGAGSLLMRRVTRTAALLLQSPNVRILVVAEALELMAAEYGITFVDEAVAALAQYWEDWERTVVIGGVVPAAAERMRQANEEVAQERQQKLRTMTEAELLQEEAAVKRRTAITILRNRLFVLPWLLPYLLPEEERPGPWQDGKFVSLLRAPQWVAQQIYEGVTGAGDKGEES